MGEYKGAFRIDERLFGLTGIDAEVEGGLEYCGKARRIEDGLPEGFEGYVYWGNV